MTYFLTKSHYQQNRKWELQDRHFKEAEAYLDTSRSIVERIYNFEYAILQGLKNAAKLYEELSDGEIFEKTKKNYEEHLVALEEIPKLIWDTVEMKIGIYILDDKRLSDLDDSLNALIKPELSNMYSIIKRLGE